MLVILFLFGLSGAAAGKSAMPLPAPQACPRCVGRLAPPVNAHLKYKAFIFKEYLQQHLLAECRPIQLALSESITAWGWLIMGHQDCNKCTRDQKPSLQEYALLAGPFQSVLNELNKLLL